MLYKVFNNQEHHMIATRASGKKVAEGINYIQIEPCGVEKIKSGDGVKYTVEKCGGEELNGSSKYNDRLYYWHGKQNHCEIH
jgi:hypothetical protein